MLLVLTRHSLAPATNRRGQRLAAVALALACLAGCSDGSNTNDDAMTQTVSGALAALCADDLGVSSADCAKLATLAMPANLPPARGNLYADNEEAALLGFRIFYDSRISNIGDVRCATCHEPESYFGDGVPVPEVVEGSPGNRNSPTILTAAWMQPFMLWDGKADSLWSQPLFAFEHPNEMASSRLELAHAVQADEQYRERYEAVFGALPALEDKQRFPVAGKPGDPSYDQMSEADQDAINRVAANVGKSLEAYMRKVAIGPGSLDLYLSGERDALTESARRGLAAFATTGCVDCHSGPAMSDGRFHRIGSNPGADPGRAAAIDTLNDNPFNLDGPYADPVGPAVERPAHATAADEGAFRTPSLRAAPLSAPYGHAGQYATLGELLDDHGAELSEEESSTIQVFLLTLDGKYPDRPWGDWPVL